MIKFKSDIIAAQFDSMDERLRHIVYALSGFVWERYAKQITLTSIFRSGDPGVHGCWRGCDVRVKPVGVNSMFTFLEIKEIERFLDHYVYDESRPLLKSYVIHGDKGQVHLHLQVNGGNFTKIFKD